MQTIQPCLMFRTEAEEAVDFYTSVFPNSKIISIARYNDDDMQSLQKIPEEQRPGPVGVAKMIEFRICGQPMLACNGGSFFEFNHGISLYVTCDTQEEIDTVWDRILAHGGKVEECGWIRDKWGVAWQVAPRLVAEVYRHDPDGPAARRVARVVFTSKKLDLAAIKKAAAGL